MKKSLSVLHYFQIIFSKVLSLWLTTKYKTNRYILTSYVCYTKENIIVCMSVVSFLVYLAQMYSVHYLLVMEPSII